MDRTLTTYWGEFHEHPNQVYQKHNLNNNSLLSPMPLRGASCPACPCVMRRMRTHGLSHSPRRMGEREF